MLKYLSSFIYEYVTLIDPKCERDSDIPIYKYVNKPTNSLRMVSYSYQSSPGRWLTGYRYESYSDTTQTAVPS